MRTDELELENKALKQELKTKDDQYREELKAKDEQIAELKDKVSLLETLYFGPKSEKLTCEDERQGRLFNEAEEEAFKQTDDGRLKSGIPTREVSTYTRRAINRNQGRKPISKDLPREVVTYDISENEKICACGTHLTHIGEEVTERIQIIPAKVTVLQEKRLKYACKKCEGTFADTPGIITALGKKHLLPGSIATSSLLSWALTEKFEYALPFYRQEKRLEHIGVHIPRATLAGCAIRAGERCRPLYELLKKHIQSGSLINADETTVQVLKESGRKPQDTSWMHVYLGGREDRKGVIFHYSVTRASEVPKEFLAGFKGKLQTDDLSAYQTAVRELNKTRRDDEKIIHLLCWAHARRKFHNAYEVTKSEHARCALEFIKDIFELEKLRDTHSATGFLKLRKNRASVIFDQFESWMTDLYPRVPQSSLIGKAIAYTLGNWKQLVAYIEYPGCVPSNNLAENAIRPFVIGRKNWIFFDTSAGAEASAIIYSLIETAKLCGLNPYDYLWYIFEKLPYAIIEEDYRQLLPFNLTPEQIKPSG